MIYFTSDTHFYHKNILTMNGRPFQNTFEMHEYIIQSWNSIVGKDDEVYFLGDLTWGNPKGTKEILDRLNGKIYFIKGNHDKLKDLNKHDIIKRFEWLKDYYEIKYPFDGKDYHIVMMHYPILSWNKKYHGSIHIHGHCHGNIKEIEATMRIIDVGIDNIGYFPISIEQIIKIQNAKVFEKSPHVDL